MIVVFEYGDAVFIREQFIINDNADLNTEEFMYLSDHYERLKFLIAGAAGAYKVIGCEYSKESGGYIEMNEFRYIPMLNKVPILIPFRAPLGYDTEAKAIEEAGEIRLDYIKKVGRHTVINESSVKRKFNKYFNSIKSFVV